MKTFQTIKSRKQAATEIHECMKGYERELALAYSTIYRAIRYNPKTTHGIMKAVTTQATIIIQPESSKVELSDHIGQTSLNTHPQNRITMKTNNNPTTMNAKETTVTVSVTDNGNKCEYTTDGKVLAAITYRKEFDAYDVNTPTVGYMTADVTEAHKACESGVNWLLGYNATFDYSAVEEYNTKHYAAI